MSSMRLRLKLALVGAGRPSWQIARAIGLRPDKLSRITSGAADPSPELRAKLAEHLGIPEQELFDDAELEVPAGSSLARANA